MDISPPQSPDIAFSKPTEAGKKKCTLYVVILAGCIYQLHDLITCQELTLFCSPFYFVCLVYLVHRIAYD